MSALLVLSTSALLILWCVTYRTYVDDDLRAMAYSFRAPTMGVLKPRLRYYDLFQVVKRLSRDRKGDRRLFDFEKWIFDNFYLIKQAIDQVKGVDWQSLPYSGGIPRVLRLATYAVKHVQLGAQSIKDLLTQVQQITPLTWQELAILPTAIKKALLDELKTVAAYSRHCHRMYDLAQEALSKQLLTDDCYVYYHFEDEVPAIYREIVDTARRQFFLTLVDWEHKVKGLIGALRFCSLDMQPEYLIGLSASLPLLSEEAIEMVSTDTKLQYLSCISRIADQCNLQESLVVGAVNRIAQLSGEDVSIVLTHPKAVGRFVRKGTIKWKSGTVGSQRAFMAVCSILSLALASLPSIFSPTPLTIAGSVLLLAPLLIGVEQILKSLARHRTYDFCMSYDKVPDHAKTLVVVSRYIDGKGSFDDANQSILALSYNSPPCNLTYCLLMDFAPSDKEWGEEDDNLLDYIKQTATTYPHIAYLVRSRVPDGNQYVAWERKRGAVLQLFGAVLGEEKPFVFQSVPLSGYAYALLLDDDSKLLPGGVLDAVNCMLHPANAKYDILSFEAAVNKFSLDTGYSRRFADVGRSVGYPTHGDFYDRAFGWGLFCGKAIVRISPFYHKLRYLFPTKRILSHDVIEGAFLRTGSIHRTIYEDAPRSFLSDMTRLSRWQRGDLLLSPYLLPKAKDQNGNRFSVDIQPVYRWVMALNILGAVKDLCLFVAILLGCIGNPYLIVAAWGASLLPYLWAGLGALFVRDTFGQKVKRGAQCVIRGIERTIMIPYFAAMGAGNLLSVVWGRMRRQNMLSWRPYYLTQKGSGFGKYLLAGLPSLLFCLAGVATLSIPFFAYAGAYLVYYLWSYWFYLPRQSKPLDEEQRKQLFDVAKDTLGYFRSYRGLIADNMQLDPKPQSRDMTSPTDLGFSLLAEVCALYLGYDQAEAVERIVRIVDNILALPTWHGHLYNWYDLDGKVLGEVVSTVDSANFVTSVRVTIRALIERGYSKEASRLEPFLQADFARLYDWDRKALYISYNVKEKTGSGAYDTLMSESRLAYLLAIAQGIPMQSYTNLSRDIGKGGVILSWGGTSFEYLMPALFVRAPRYSLVRQAEKRAAVVQSKAKIMGAWGIGESCYYALGEDMRYRYQANGLRALAFAPELGREVVSPYSSALALPYLPKSVVLNLSTLSLTAYGKFGFFESIERNHVVPVYMAHHQGMLLAALTNALKDDCLCDLFESDPEIASALMLLQEGEKHGKGVKLGHHISQDAPRRSFVYDKDYLAGHVLQSKSLKGVFLSDGRAEIAKGDVLFGGSCLGLWQKPDGRIWVKDLDEGTVYSPYGLLSPYDDCVFETHSDEVVYRNRTHDLADSIRVLPAGDGILHNVAVTNTSDHDKEFAVAAYTSLALTTKGAMDSHRCYQDLFVVTEKKDDAVYAYRQTADGNYNHVVVGLLGVSDVNANSNRANVLSASKEVDGKVFDTIGNTGNPPFGNVLYPCAALSGKVIVKAGETAHVYWYMTTTADPEATVKAWRQHYVDKIYHYLPMATTEKGAELYDKYAGKEVGYLVAAALLNHLPPSADGKDKHLSIPLSGKWEEDLSVAVATRMLLGFGFVMRSPKLPDVKSHLLTRIAGATGEAVSVDPSWRKWDYHPPLKRVDKPSAQVDYQAGEGGFVADRYFVTGEPTMPYSNVVSNGKVGFVLSHRGGGWMFGDNAREVKYSPWASDPVADPPFMRLWARWKEGWYPLIGAGSLCVHAPDSTTFFTSFDGVQAEVKWSVWGEQIVLDIQTTLPLPVFCGVDVPLHWTSDRKTYLKRVSSNQAVLCHPDGKRLMLYCPKATFVTSDEALTARIEGTSYDGKRYDYLGCITPSSTHSTIAFGGKNGANYRLPLPFDDSLPALGYLLGGLWRQTVSSRLMARAGYYQCGGAYGFRDQLQDLAAYLYYDPSFVKEKLVDFARHQYLAGDVMHWWHPPRTGVRTKIRDDRLFLVSTATRYIQMTGDTGLLVTPVEYLSSDPLQQGENSRYETPSLTRPYPFSHHLYMAIDSVLEYGKHDLLKVYGGDWNDGMDKVGAKGEGESVWLSMFAYRTIKESLDLFGKEHRTRFIKELSRLKKGIENAFCQDRFLAYYDDNGNPIGDGRGNCALYLLTQAWGELSGAVEERISRLALTTARSLVDYDKGIVRLFDPPFAIGDKVGYIAAYPRGIRENGGQYTHAAIWYLLALVQAGEQDYAYELFEMISPIRKGVDYRAEPYVLAADVYSASGYEGQAGWSWYTGSAGWALRLIVEGFYGVRIQNGNLFLEPKLPKALFDTTLYWTYRGTTYHIRYGFGNKNDLLVDGRSVGKYFPLCSDKDTVDVECVIKRPTS